MPHAAIDIHTHILPPGWEDWATRYGVSGWPSCRVHDACNATIYLGEKEFRKVNEAVDELVARANRQLDADGIPAAKRRFRQIAECRYAGQGFELRAEMPNGPLTAASAKVVNENFYSAHKQVYGHAFRDQSCEIITVRVIATVEVETLLLPKLAKGGRDNPRDAMLYSRRTVFDDGTARDTPRYRREKLLADDRVFGPALIVQHNSTTLVPPGYVATVMRFGDMLVARAT